MRIILIGAGKVGHILADRLTAEEHDVTISKSGMKPFTVDGVVMVDTPWLPMLYCKYSPMTLFKNDRGPKMHQLSFGICF